MDSSLEPCFFLLIFLFFCLFFCGRVYVSLLPGWLRRAFPQELGRLGLPEAPKVRLVWAAMRREENGFVSEAAPGCQLHAVLRCVLEARLLCGSDPRRLPGVVGEERG